MLYVNHNPPQDEWLCSVAAEIEKYDRCPATKWKMIKREIRNLLEFNMFSTSNFLVFSRVTEDLGVAMGVTNRVILT